MKYTDFNLEVRNNIKNTFVLKITKISLQYNQISHSLKLFFLFSYILYLFSWTHIKLIFEIKIQTS